jgi:hypothetical protein
VLFVSPATADEGALRRDVEYLASPELAGRLTGSDGERLAAAYLAGRLSELGALPLPGRDGYELPFTFTAGTRDVGTTLAVTDANGEQRWGGASFVQALSFSEAGAVRAPAVFAGYGIVVPEGTGSGYDSYAGLDVTGKVVVVLRYFPEDASPDTRAQLARYSGLRYKALQARERGAAALLIVTGPRSPHAGEVVAMGFDTAVAGSGLVAASVAGPVAERLFAVSGRDLAAAQAALDDGNPHVAGFDLPGVEVALDVKVEREERTAVNVAGFLPGRSGVAEPWIVLGAHYDHLGTGRSADSLAEAAAADAVHPGADDNASGVAAVLAAGAELAAGERTRHVALAFWSGEELGVLGSSAFLRDAVLPPADIAAYLNFDMVGRLRDNRLTLQAAGSSDVWPRLVERINVPLGFDLAIADDPYLPTDATPFYQADVPTLNFFTGSHEDYHKPSDTADKIAYGELERVSRFGARLADELAGANDPPRIVEVAPTRAGGGDRDTLRAYTGTIPDYASEVEGLRLSGVVEGGPAAAAGLAAGDIIVEFGGQTIANIYDYTYALDAVKIGLPVTVVFLRNGARHEAVVVPRERP